MSIPIKMSLNINQADIQNAILREMAKQLNVILLQVVSDDSLKTNVRELVGTQIINSPEFDSLLSGDLAAIFGLKDSSSILVSIVETIKNSIEVTHSPAIVVAGVLNASITVSVLKSDFSDVLSLPGVSYTTDGGEVNWLEWLLKAGDGIVIGDYTAVLVDTPISRTGHAIMKKSSRGFRVPPEYAGTINNNWLTRALEDLEHPIGNLIFLELDKRI